MGKKLKTGKARRDKFYHLAKEIGYRSRSSFKLIQLNRKFQFLQKARVLVDLCAAPGGWLQVASNSMPVSSLIIGVDLVPIKPIPNVISIQEDITTDKCRQALRRELHTWKADVFLNDGAPNVGSSWSHDAFSQAHLTLMALRLASEFLGRGGTFVSKVFRSQDYQPLLWVLNQLFRKVQATKPQASRTESAEIFLVCQGYNAPDKIDRKFFDPKHVFKQVETQVRTVHDLVKSKKPKADGYTEGDYTLFHRVTLLDFLKCPNPIDTLDKASEITFDSPQLETHPETTQEIRECCKDLRVLGRKELGILLKWRRRLRACLGQELRGGASEPHVPLGASEDKEGGGAEAANEDEERQLDEQLAEMKAGELAELRRQKRKMLKSFRRLRERAQLGLDLPGVSVADDMDVSLFSIAPLGGSKMKEMEKGDMAVADLVLLEGEGAPEGLHLSEEELSDVHSMDSEAEADKVKEPREKIRRRRRREQDVSREEAVDNPLLVHLVPLEQRLAQTTSLWFSKDGFSGLDTDPDPSLEIEHTEKLCRQQAARQQKENRESAKTSNETAQPEEESDGDSSSDERVIPDLKSRARKRISSEPDGDFFDIVPVKKCVRVLDAEGLAMGTAIATSKRKERDLVDYTFNRYTFTEPEEQLPDWFVDNELRFCQRPPPFDPAMAREFRERWREINARPIKKIAEAKARKKRRMMKRMEELRKKADTVVNTIDIGEKEKMAQLRSLYKKARLGREKREITYVVIRRGSGAKMGRPPGVTGRYRRVDARMKKDSQKVGQERRGKGRGRR